MNKKVLWITRTALFIALLVAFQAVTASLGQYVTGSVVNLILILATLFGGFSSGLTVAILSPICAKLVGIGPAFWEMIPFVALGNAVLVICWFVVVDKIKLNKYVTYIIATVSAAVLKFVALFLGVTKLCVPIILALPEPKASIISANFSFPQLITAAIGGALAILIVPALSKALKIKK